MCDYAVAITCIKANTPGTYLAPGRISPRYIFSPLSRALLCRLLLFLLLLFFRKRRISRAERGLGSSSGWDEMSISVLRDIVVGGRAFG